MVGAPGRGPGLELGSPGDSRRTARMQQPPAGRRAGPGLDPQGVGDFELSRGRSRLAVLQRMSPAPDAGRNPAASASFARLLEVPQAIGPFKILRQLGAGGMGIVFLAQQERPSRTVALK